MTDHEFAVGVLRILIVVMAILGTALALERVFERRPRGRRPRYWMPSDIHDEQRRNAKNGRRAWLGFR